MRWPVRWLRQTSVQGDVGDAPEKVLPVHSSVTWRQHSSEYDFLVVWGQCLQGEGVKG